MAARSCTVAGCGRTHKAKGLCDAHYAKAAREELPAYVVRRLHGLSADAPPEMIEVCRLIIQIRRELRKRQAEN